MQGLGALAQALGVQVQLLPLLPVGGQTVQVQVGPTLPAVREGPLLRHLHRPGGSAFGPPVSEAIWTLLHHLHNYNSDGAGTASRT